MTPRPLVSVLTATYDGAAFVGETIESVLRQSYEPIEHVLVDDASSDATLAILREYESRYPERIRVVAAPERAGPCRRRNDAFGVAKGELVAWLDHDDLWLPAKIERQVEALLVDPRAGFAYTQWEEFDHASGGTLSRSDLDLHGDVLQPLFERGCVVASSTVLVRRSAVERRGLRFRETDFSFGDDYFLWLALALDWRAVLVDEMLVRLRRHGANESTRLGRENTYLSSLALLDEFVRTFPDAEAKLGRSRRLGIARHWAAAAEFELTRGRRGRAAAYAGRAARLDPRGAMRFALGTAKRRAARAM